KILATEVGMGPDTATWPQYDAFDNDGDGAVDETDESNPAFLFYREQNLWQTKIVASAVTGDLRRVTFPFVATTIRDVFDLGHGTMAQLRWDYTYDDYGNVTETREYGRTEPGWNDERVTKSKFTAAYGSGLTHWLLDRLVERSVEDGQGRLASRSRYYYDGSGNLGEVSAADLTKVE